MSARKPTLEDVCRMVSSVRARLAKDLIGLSVTIQTFPLDPPKPANQHKDKPSRSKP
jgi:hypothetical protein